MAKLVFDRRFECEVRDEDLIRICGELCSEWETDDVGIQDIFIRCEEEGRFHAQVPQGEPEAVGEVWKQDFYTVESLRKELQQ